MQKGHTRDATRADIPLLADDLRDADLAEIKAASGKHPEAALLNGLLIGSSTRVACFHDDTPAAIYGVVPMGYGGAIWMVATNQFKLLHRQFLREGQEELQRMSEGYPLLFNFTDARNTVHHRWIKWVGFTIINRHEKYGVEKRPFLEFVRITEGRYV